MSAKPEADVVWLTDELLQVVWQVAQDMLVWDPIVEVEWSPSQLTLWLVEAS